MRDRSLWRYLSKAAIFPVISMVMGLHASAVSVVTALFHCPTTCKVYIDGKLEFSLPQGGVRRIHLVRNQDQLVMIVRPGKPDWVHSVSPNGPLLFNPAESGPTSIEEGQNTLPFVAKASAKQEFGSSSSSTKADSNGTPSGVAARSSSRLPVWAAGSWTFKVKRKKFRFVRGATNCAATVDQDLYLDFRDSNGEGPRRDNLNFAQFITIEDDTDPCLAIDERDQEWSFDYYIRTTPQDDETVRFEANMDQCGALGCKLPPGGRPITGSIRRLSQDEVEVTLEGPLPGSFKLQRVSTP